MNSKVLYINFPKLATLILPIELRKDRLLAVLSALVTPFSVVLSVLTGMRSDKLQELKYNGQTCRLEYCLNYIFGNLNQINNIKYSRRILVKDGTDSNGKPYIIYMRNVDAVYDKPKRRGESGQVILNRRSVNNEIFYNFIIECPEEYYKEQELRAVVNTYKLQSKTWKVVLKYN